MLGIETKLLIAFYLQIDGQIKRTNQELEQYLIIHPLKSTMDES